MPRKGPVPKRQVFPDPRFNSRTVAHFINKIMLAGKKSVAERITYGAMTIVGEKTGKDPMEVFTQAMNNAMPLVAVRPRRGGGGPPPPRRRRHLPGPNGSPSGPPAGHGHALAYRIRPQAPRQDHGRPPRRGASRRGQQSGRIGEEARGHSPHG